MVKPLIACVKVGTKYGPDYVVALRNGVRKHLDRPHDFVCFTEEPIEDVRCEPVSTWLPGWWAKLMLFRLEKPLVYFDLDMIITGDLSPIVDWDGLGFAPDPSRNMLGSNIMKLTGKERFVWDTFKPDTMQRLHGDQDWIAECIPDAPTFPMSWVPSFKLHNCIASPPADARIVNFHGLPKPHQISSGWVRDHWRATA